MKYRLIDSPGAPIKAWVEGVPLEDAAQRQLQNVASMPFIYKWLAVMPDVHWGRGATVGSVIATDKAIIPAAVGVDLGCGMAAVRLSLRASDLPTNLSALRSDIEQAIPHGRSNNGGEHDRGAWGTPPGLVTSAWAALAPGFQALCEKHPSLERCNSVSHLGTLGTGNHFVEICLDEEQYVWAMLHSGSRGVGNRIGSYFIELAKKDMAQHIHALPDQDLAYIQEGSQHFDDYVTAVSWAQEFARANREVMLQHTLAALRNHRGIPPFEVTKEAVQCHHNYISRETHYGKDVWVTRKGAVRAGEGELGIIPGSMGAKSFIVRGKGNPESFMSCSHGAGRKMSRNEAKRVFTVEDHEIATAGVECRKDKDVVDETPGAYKDIDAVMSAQSDLVDVVHTIKQILCVKG